MSNTSRFNFIGNIVIPKEKENFTRNWKGGNKNSLSLSSISFGVKAGNNTEFVRMFDTVFPSIKTRSVNGEQIEINYEDRFDEEVVKNVATYRKHYIDLGEGFERKEFISATDAIEYLAENLPKYNGLVQVTGIWEKNLYNGQIKDRFALQNVYAVADTIKPRLNLTMDFFYNSDCIDDEESNRVYVNGFVEHYERGVAGNPGKVFFVPQTAVLDGTKLNMTDERHQKLWDYKVKYLRGAKRKMSHILWECGLVNGAQEVEFSEAELTDSQREQIELGIKTVDDFKPKGNIYGEKVREIRLKDPKLVGQFTDGLLECDDTNDEFEEKIYKFETLDDVLSPAKETKKTSVTEDDDDDLFI